MQKCLNQNSRVAFNGWLGFFVGEIDKLDIKSANFDFPAKLDTALMHQAALTESYCLEYVKEHSRSIHT